MASWSDYFTPDIGGALPEGSASPDTLAKIRQYTSIAPRAIEGMARGVADIPRKAIEAAADYNNTGMYEPRSILNAAGLAMTGGLGGTASRAGEAALGAGPIRAYQGSPHDFDAFSMDKVGTGEGAQQYGHGLYFAGNEDVAKTYRDMLKQWTIEGKPADPMNPSHIASATLEHFGGDRAKAIDDLALSAAKGPKSERARDAQAVELLRNGEMLPKATGQSHMYEVNINADPEHFLDWDKPVSQQSEHVQNALATHGLKAKPVDLGNFGGFPIQGAPRWASNAEEAQALREAGIPGIKYLDKESRSAGKGSSNYVVFDDKLIDILRKYGWAGLAAAPNWSNFFTRENKT
jgi:hypothetical protein